MPRFFDPYALNQMSEPIARSTPPIDRSGIAELEKLVARQGLLIETLARLLMAKGVVQEGELDQWMEYVDQLDGVADGKLKARKTPHVCPSCRRANPPHLAKCMYCSSEFPQKFLTDPAEAPEDRRDSRG